MIDKIQAGDIFAVVEQWLPTEPRWTLVRRYRIPHGSNFDGLFGAAAIIEGVGAVRYPNVIEPKGKPDNLSALTEEWINEQRFDTGFKRARLEMVFTCVTQRTVAMIVGGVHDALLTGGDDDCVSAYFGLDPEWHDGSRAAAYRLVAWRMEPKVVAEEAVPAVTYESASPHRNPPLHPSMSSSGTHVNLSQRSPG